MKINADTFDGTLTLINSEGEEVVVDVLDWFKWNSQEYIVVTNDDFDLGEVAILQVVHNDDGSESYVIPENEADEQTLLDIFVRRLGDFVSLDTELFD